MRKLLLKLAAALVFFVPISAFASTASGGGEELITHRMMVLVLQLGVILVAAKIGSIVATKFKQPGVLGELIVGAMIGPFALGGMGVPLFPDGLFSSHASFPVTPELYGICSVASIVLLFMVGLETDLRLFLRYSLAGSLVGLGGVLFSFILGDLLAVYASGFGDGPQIGFMAPRALFFGVISTATSVGITARILSEMRKLDSPEGVTVLSGAIIDDVLGIIMLAVTVGIIAASKATGSIDWGRIGIISSKAILVWLAATAVGLVAAHRIGRMLKLFHSRSAITLIAFGLALLMAGLFEQAGLAMIIGAYVMGLSLSRTDVTHVIREHLTGLSNILVPVFFTVMGMLVDLRSFTEPSVIVLTIVFSLTAAAAKFLGCGVPALFCGFNLMGAARIGVGMLPRGEVALIIAGIGLASGAMDQDSFSIAVMMTLLTTLAAPPMLVSLFTSDRSGTRNLEERKSHESVTVEFPSNDVADLIGSRLLEVFEEDGFFVHAIEQNLHQLRKDTTVISLERTEANFTFHCAARDIPFVHTAVYEVLADIDRIAKALREPIDRKSLAKEVQKAVKGAGSGLSLKEKLTADLLVPEIKGATKEEVIDELLDVLKRAGKLSDVEKAREAVWERENSMSTGMQYGIAIPHGKTDSVHSMACVVGIRTEGIEWDSLDGKPARIFVMVLSPQSSVGPHVRFLSIISQVLDEEGRAALLNCKTSGEMLRVLAEGQKSNS